MPAILERLVSQLQAKGTPKKSAYAIATSQLQKAGDLKKGSQEATPKGIQRGAMTPAARAKDRAAKYSSHKASDFQYNSKKNSTKLK